MTLFEPSPPRMPRSWRGEDPSPFAAVHRHRRRRALAWLWVGSLLLALALAGTVALLALPLETRIGLGEAIPAARGLLHVPDPPTAEVAALADRMYLTDEGRQLFYGTKPRLGGDEVAELCARPGDDRQHGVADGCYRPGVAGVGSIVIYRPSDERLSGSMITTAAHEMLHAAYDRLDVDIRVRVDQLVAAETARVPAEDPVHRQIEWSVGGYPGNVGTEEFAYLGSQIELDGGFAPELEAVYARYFTDRAALVGAYTQSNAVLQGVADQLQAASNAAADAELSAATARAQYEADRAWDTDAVQTYNADAARYNAADPATRDRVRVAWVLRDGRTTTGSWGDVLASRLRELDALRADLDARGPQVVAQEQSAADLRTKAEAMAADVKALFADAAPG
ncbi:hypothetical protein ABCS02_11005 [Microbacterium sp. X-17]|uniref:hypothetical protein n=1 Tax=Microbacterium sp. X-17 TaxID=3144404 RepID=UPI0031F5B19F